MASYKWVIIVFTSACLPAVAALRFDLVLYWWYGRSIVLFKLCCLDMDLCRNDGIAVKSPFREVASEGGLVRFRSNSWCQLTAFGEPGLSEFRMLNIINIWLCMMANYNVHVRLVPILNLVPAFPGDHAVTHDSRLECPVVFRQFNFYYAGLIFWLTSMPACLRATWYFSCWFSQTVLDLKLFRFVVVEPKPVITRHWCLAPTTWARKVADQSTHVAWLCKWRPKKANSLASLASAH